MKKFALIYLSLFLLLLPAIAGATLIISPGLVGGSGDVENVLFNAVGLIAGPATTVTGKTNQTGSLVNFTGNDLLVTPSGGQARIEAVDGFFDYLSIEMADPTLGFSKIQFNIDSAFDGTVDLAFKDQFGTVFSGTFALDDNGQNFFTAYSLDNQVIVSALINSTIPLQAITDLAQIRIGPASIGTDVQPVPEPATLLLLGAGLAGLAGYKKRKSKVN